MSVAAERNAIVKSGLCTFIVPSIAYFPEICLTSSVRSQRNNVKDNDDDN